MVRALYIWLQQQVSVWFWLKPILLDIINANFKKEASSKYLSSAKFQEQLKGFEAPSALSNNFSPRQATTCYTGCIWLNMTILYMVTAAWTIPHTSPGLVGEQEAEHDMQEVRCFGYTSDVSFPEVNKIIDLSLHKSCFIIWTPFLEFAALECKTS